MQLLDAPESKKLFPPDVLKRAKEYLDATGSGGTGAYTHSQGVELCRQHVAMVCCLLQLDPIHAFFAFFLRYCTSTCHKNNSLHDAPACYAVPLWHALYLLE